METPQGSVRNGKITKEAEIYPATFSKSSRKIEKCFTVGEGNEMRGMKVLFS